MLSHIHWGKEEHVTTDQPFVKRQSHTLIATMCFLSPADASAADSHVRSRLAHTLQFSKDNWGGYFHARGQTQIQGHSLNDVRKVQEEFKGSRASFSQLALL